MLHLNTIDPVLYKVLQDLCRLPELSNFVLAGGTSLSLQTGHRRSDDLDFFTDRSFDIIEVKNAVLRYNQEVIFLDGKKHGFSFSLPLPGNPADTRKLDVYNWAVKFIRPVKQEGVIRLASLEDIAAFKLDAISHRKEKKDYVDIAILLEKFSFGQMLDFYKEKFPMNDKRIVLTQILDIDGWENSVEPVMLIDLSPKKAFEQIKEKVIAFSTQQIKAKNEKDAERLKRATELLNRKKKQG